MRRRRVGLSKRRPLLGLRKSIPGLGEKKVGSPAPVAGVKRGRENDENACTTAPSVVSKPPVTRPYRRRLGGLGGKRRLLSLGKKSTAGMSKGKLVFKPPVKAKPAEADRYFTTLYCKRSKKKHKTWSDGLLVVKGRKLTLRSEEDKSLGCSMFSHSTEFFGEGSQVFVRGYECEIQKPVSEEDYLAGRVFKTTGLVVPQQAKSLKKRKPSLSSKVRGEGRVGIGGGAAASKSLPKCRVVIRNSPFSEQALCLNEDHCLSAETLGQFWVAPSSVASDASDEDRLAAMKCTAGSLSLSIPREVMSKWKGADKESGARCELPVVLDPLLSSVLRPHQRSGVQFMYRALTRSHGCILADEMGLGKTLQTISLLWAMLKSGPYGTPILSKAIVVAPTSLLKNWDNEFKKWLGYHRCKPLLVSSGATRSEQMELVQTFVASNVQCVLLISYELLRKHVEMLSTANRCIVICDEGHRLKNICGNKTIQALCGVGSLKRLLLTGTPVQNNLKEYYAMCNFVNPGVFGGISAFRHMFETPIQTARDAQCSEEAKKVGRARAQELKRLSSEFVLRRTSAILSRDLPPRAEYAVFCPMSTVQAAIYTALIGNKQIRSFVLRNSNGDALTSASALNMITLLKKVSNHGGLFYRHCVSALTASGNSLSVRTDSSSAGESSHSPKASRGFVARARVTRFQLAHEFKSSPSLPFDPCSILDILPVGYNDARVNMQLSAKLQCLQPIITKTLERGEKLVVVSNYTATLDLIQLLCRERLKLTPMRLDGSTAPAARQKLVDAFNRASNPPACNVFLLSAKAGGVGLNLVGANRLVLFDPDWNPSTDLQVMGRIWRYGQQKQCYIYRLLSVGSIDEKIFQRQIRKQEMAESVVGDENKRAEATRHFSKKDLKRLFVFNANTECETYDLLAKNSSVKMKWDCHRRVGDIRDPVLSSVSDDLPISFIMEKHENVPDAPAPQ